MLWLILAIILLVIAIAGGAIVHPILFALPSSRSSSPSCTSAAGERPTDHPGGDGQPYGRRHPHPGLGETGHRPAWVTAPSA